MSNNVNLRATPQGVEAAIVESKRRAAEILLEQLTQFADSIAADASGDGEFDLELSNSIQVSRACLLRYIAINSPQRKTAISEISGKTA